MRGRARSPSTRSSRWTDGSAIPRPRSTQAKLRVAEVLEELPAIATALEAGKLSWSAVRELTRVAISETEQAWLGTFAVLRDAIDAVRRTSGGSFGSLDDDDASMMMARHVLGGTRDEEDATIAGVVRGPRMTGILEGP